MEKSKLSDVFSMTTLMIHDATTDLYEELHDKNGDPIDSIDAVSDKCRVYKTRVFNEIQMILDMCFEYNESHGRLKG